MRLFHLITEFTSKNRFEIPDVDPDLNRIIKWQDLSLDSPSLLRLKSALREKDSEFFNRLLLHLSYNNVLLLNEKGRFLIVRDRNLLHWVIDLDHTTFIPLKRDLILEEII